MAIRSCSFLCTPIIHVCVSLSFFSFFVFILSLFIHDLFEHCPSTFPRSFVAWSWIFSFPKAIHDIFEICWWKMVKNGRATSIRKRYIFKKCEKIIFFLKTIFLGFVRNDKKKKMAVKMLDFRIRKKHVSLNKFKKKIFNSTSSLFAKVSYFHVIFCIRSDISFWHFFPFFGYAHRETTLVLAW